MDSAAGNTPRVVQRTLRSTFMSRLALIIIFYTKISDNWKFCSDQKKSLLYLTPEVEVDYSKLRRSWVEFLGTIERELSRDSIYLVLGRSPFVVTSSLSPRIFQIDVLSATCFCCSICSWNEYRLGCGCDRGHMGDSKS